MRDGGPKYTGLHSLRHFYASWCINRQKDGGRGLPPKNVQERLGHSSITITLDTYGHLFRADDTRGDGRSRAGADLRERDKDVTCGLKASEINDAQQTKNVLVSYSPKALGFF